MFICLNFKFQRLRKKLGKTFVDFSKESKTRKIACEIFWPLESPPHFLVKFQQFSNDLDEKIHQLETPQIRPVSKQHRNPNKSLLLQKFWLRVFQNKVWFYFPSHLSIMVIRVVKFQAGVKVIYTKYSKQFKWNSYFNVSGQNRPFWAALKLL